MFDKKYILEKLSIIFIFDIKKEDFIEFWLSYFEWWYFEDIEKIINATRELTKNHDFYVEEYKKRKKEK